MDCYQPCGALLPHLFTLTGTCVLRRLFSAALSIDSRLPGVTWHFALRSPDFPPPDYRSKQAATVRSTLRGKDYGAFSSTASVRYKKTILLAPHWSCWRANSRSRALQQSRWQNMQLINNHQLAHPNQAFHRHKKHQVYA